MLESKDALERPESGRATFKAQLSVRDVVSVYKTIFKKDQFSVVLDVKTASLPGRGIGRIAQVPNLWGFHVLGVGSFKAEQLAGLEGVTQVIDGEAMAPIRKVHFFHYISDLASAAGKKACPLGSDAMFNGAMLVAPGKSDPDGTPT